jgi:hypothetical protein
MPVRKPANKSGSHIIGKYPSLKLGRMVLFESTIERDLLFLLDYLMGATFFEEQPLTIEYSDANGKPRRYTPDVHALFNGQRCFAAGQAYCAALGWLFAVITDRALRAGFRLRNIKLLRQFAVYEIAPQTRGAIYGVLNATPAPQTIAQIKAALSLPPALTQTALFSMAYHHEIGLPVDMAPISDSTPVYRPGQLAEARIL